MDEETVDVAPSEENGNLPLDTPSEQVEEVEGAEPKEEAAQPAEVQEPELFELPDGRKVDAETLSKEWKDQFLPEFTRKSQALAEIEKSKLTNTPYNPLADPNYQPSNYDELAQQFEARAEAKAQAKEEARIADLKARDELVISQLAEVKKLDPTVNENSLFIHANEYRSKYGASFPDLMSVYKHLKDSTELTKKVQKTTADNIAKRNDPVSVSPGATGARPDPSQFGNAIEYLRSLQG
jgi:hypothetical protein